MISLVPMLGPMIALGLTSGSPPAGRTAATPTPDYKLIIWYRRADPLGSYKRQAYDVRKGQYTRAVDDWLTMMERRHPEYAAYAVDVILDRVPGRTDRDKLAEVSARELRPIIAALAPPGGLTELFHPPGLDVSRPTTAVGRLQGLGFGPSPGSGGSSPMSAAPSPFPYPYVRPHP